VIAGSVVLIAEFRYAWNTYAPVSQSATAQLEAMLCAMAARAFSRPISRSSLMKSPTSSDTSWHEALNHHHTARPWATVPMRR
jgi:hypothetical protein